MEEHELRKDEAYRTIMNGIISNEFKPGEPLNERALMEKYGYSKSTVREALLMLCAENILRAIPRYGYQVVQLTSENVNNLLQYRMILESGFLRCSYNGITPEQIQELVFLNEICENSDSGDDYWAHWDHNKAFHLKMISFANNAYAYDELDRSMDILKRAYAQFYHDRWNKSVIRADVKSHTPLIDALGEKNIEKACRLLKDDLKDFGCI